MKAARDKDGTLHLFPDNFGTIGREDDHWRFYTVFSILHGDEWFGSIIDKTHFPDLKWEDEPIDVVILPIATEKDVAKMIDSIPIHCCVCSNYHCDDCEYSKNKFKTREHAMMHHLKNALDIAEDGSNLFRNDSLGCSFCKEIKEMIEKTMERIQKDIDDYHITE